jgi:hypothetical protein
LIDTFNTPGHLFDLFIKDSILYAADRDSLLIFNIVDPANVHIIGSLGVPPGGVYDVFVDSIYAYLACASTVGDDGRMQIVDVSDPANPQLLGEEFCNGDGHGIFVTNGCVYMATQDWWFGKKSGDEQKVRADVEGGIRIFDPETTSNPILLCGYNTPGNPQELWVQGDLIFVADYDSFQILRHYQSSVEEKSMSRVGIRHYIKVFPTPFRDVLNIDFILIHKEQITIEVFDIQGRKVKTIYRRNLQAGHFIFYWPGTDDSGQGVPAGVYYAKITAGSDSYRSKVLYIKE